MNSRQIIDFFKRPTGQIIGFIGIVLICLAGVYFFGQNDKEAQKKKDDAAQTAGNTGNPDDNFKGTAVVERQTPRGYDIVPTPTPAPVSLVDGKPTERPVIEQKRAPLSVYAGPAPQATPVPAPPVVGPFENGNTGDTRYAPYGRLLKCVLINTVDSVNTTTPLIGLVMEDLWWDGKIVIPANTEIHGIASSNPVQQRIASQGGFHLILAPNDVNPKGGEELDLQGIALDRDEADVQSDNSGEWKPHFGITDASAGMKGRVIKSDNWAEIKLFAAELIKGAAGGFAQTTTTVFGNVPVGGSAANAGIGAANAVLDRYAEQILNTIERDGFYVQVPAGKQFYLYVMQPVDLRYASYAPAPDPAKKVTVNGAVAGADDDAFTTQMLSTLQASRQKAALLQQQIAQRQQQVQAGTNQRQNDVQQQDAAVQQQMQQILRQGQQGEGGQPTSP